MGFGLGHPCSIVTDELESHNEQLGAATASQPPLVALLSSFGRVLIESVQGSIAARSQAVSAMGQGCSKETGRDMRRLRRTASQADDGARDAQHGPPRRGSTTARALAGMVFFAGAVLSGTVAVTADAVAEPETRTVTTTKTERTTGSGQPRVVSTSESETETAPFPDVWQRAFSTPLFQWLMFLVGVGVSFLSAAATQRAVLGLYGLKLGPVEVPELPDSTADEALRAARESRKEANSLAPVTVPDASLDGDTTNEVSNGERESLGPQLTQHQPAHAGRSTQPDSGTDDPPLFEEPAVSPESSSAADPDPVTDPAHRDAMQPQQDLSDERSRESIERSRRRGEKTAFELIEDFGDVRLTAGTSEELLLRLRIDLESEIVNLLGHPRVDAANSPASAIRALVHRGVLRPDLADSLNVVLQRLNQVAHGARTTSAQRRALTESIYSILTDMRTLRMSASRIFADHVAEELTLRLRDVRVEQYVPGGGDQEGVRVFDIVISGTHSGARVVIEVVPALTLRRVKRLPRLRDVAIASFGPETAVLVVAGDVTFTNWAAALRDAHVARADVCFWDRHANTLPTMVEAALRRSSK